MNNPTQRIAAILIVIFLVPALFFSVYEISSLNEDERMLEEIYQKQLETILFSVNQYADDIVISWMSKIETALGDNSINEDTIPPALQSLLQLNSALSMVFTVDQAIAKASVRVFSAEKDANDTLSSLVLSSIDHNQELIRQLIKYKKSGFVKSEVLQTNPASNNKVFVFITGSDSSNYKIAGFIIEPALFIEDLVGPRLQSVSRDQFTLSVYDKASGASVYSTVFTDTTSLASAGLSKDFWIFPDYAVGIRTQGNSIDQLVAKRTSENLLLLMGLDVVLIIAVVLVFRNVKREVQLAQNKSDFVSNVSHEIRTPLALISMFAETLEMGRVKSDEKKQEYYKIISKETQRLTGIVNKILNFSQTEAGKKKLNIERIDLVQEIKELLNTYDFHLTNKGFEYSFMNDSELWVMADREAFTEIVINLIDNAIKYSHENKQIEIHVGKTAHQGWVSVRDYGEGISKHDQKHIFDKFYRVSSGNLAKSQGTGLGLSFVKQMIEQQNGNISVSSEPGKGSTFTVYLPLADQPS